VSIQAVAWVLKQKVGDATAKHVLLSLANYAGEDGENAFPSVARLERDTELSERTIREKLGWLVEKGFIKLGDQTISAAYAKRKDRITTCYDFILRGAPIAPRQPTGCSSPQNGVQITQERGAPPAPNPSLRKPSSNKSVTQILKDREKPPEGRQATLEAELAWRFNGAVVKGSS
jgi:hypothetical protein